MSGASTQNANQGGLVTNQLSLPESVVSSSCVASILDRFL